MKNLGRTSALVMLSSCSDNDDVWSGASGWVIGVLIGIVLIVTALHFMHKK